MGDKPGNMTASDQETPRPKCRRHWLQYSVRSVLLVVLALSVVFGLWANSARRQRNAVEAIRAAGGSVYYRFHLDSTGIVYYEEKSLTPHWLVDSLGEDYFNRVQSVAFRWTNPSLYRATDDDMRHVRELRWLHELSLSGTRVTDEGLAELRGLKGLQRLTITDTPVTDDGMSHLAAVGALRYFSPPKTLKDPGLLHVAKLKELEVLNLNWCMRVTDEGLEYLGALPNLIELDLGNTRITDRGLATLGSFTQLEELTLHHTRITDAGLSHLVQLKRLKYIDLFGCRRVTDQGARRLREGLPLTKVQYP